MDRFAQANREALWSLGLALVYLVVWWLSSYLPGELWGMPLWFVASCLIAPAVFCLLVALMVRHCFVDLELGDE